MPCGMGKWTKERIVRVLCRTVLCSGLAPLEIDRLAAHAVPLTCDTGQVLFVAGEEAKGLYVIASGAVRCCRQNPEGKEQVLSVEYACAVVGEVPVFDGGRCFSTAVVPEPTELLYLTKEDVHRCCSETPELFRRMVELLAGRVRSYAELVHTLSLREVDRRVAWFVLTEAMRRGVPTDSGVAVELTVTHQEIACRIGSVREMVTRAFGHLHKAGLLSVDGRLVVIPSTDEMRKYVRPSAELSM